MNDITKVSIIIPVYNASEYIRKCLDSVLNQSLQEIEVILVDDGSTDGCGTICDEYLADPRVSVVHQQNAGGAGARNVGLSKAKGKYIGFVDADDYIDQNMYFDMTSVADHFDIDIVLGNYCIVNGGKVRANAPYLPENRVIGSDEIKCFLCEKDNSWLWFSWKCIFKRDLIERGKIKFQEDTLGEDTIFNLMSFVIAKNMFFINRPYYYYVQTPNSQIRVSQKRRLLERLNNNYLAKRRVYDENCLNKEIIYEYALNNSLPMLFANEVQKPNSIAGLAEAFKVWKQSELINDSLKLGNIREIKSFRYRIYTLLLKKRMYLALALFVRC